MSANHRKPKILLVDSPMQAAQSLSDKGFNVNVGTFGLPYKVQMRDSMSPVIPSFNLPNCTEQEIVVVDLSDPEEPVSNPDGKKRVSDGTDDWWCSCATGTIDPRPLAMELHKGDFDRIYRNGGVFVVFCHPRRTYEVCNGKVVGHSIRGDTFQTDNFSFLSVLSAANIHLSLDRGTEMTVMGGAGILGEFIERHSASGEFFSTMSPTYRLEGGGPHQFHCLLKNKFGHCVGGAVFHVEGKGVVFLLPQFSQKAAAVAEFASELLPEMRPDLFPSLCRGTWLRDREYEHHSISHLIKQQDQIRTETDKKIAELDATIAADRHRLRFLHDLLTANNSDLVSAVKTALETLGFMVILDVDVRLDPGAPKQEDLQIRDYSPVLLVEIKGISGLPRENHTLQVAKYIPRRMKEWNRTDVAGVSIINHQRNLPPLKRDNDNVFTSQQIDDAKHHDITLVTTWELFRLIRGATEHEWPTDMVKQLFYKPGRIPNVPSHYHPVGRVSHFYDKASVVSINLEETLQVNDKVGYALESGFIEEVVKSLQIDKTNVRRGEAGQCIGYKTGRCRSELKDGIILYRVGD